MLLNAFTEYFSTLKRDIRLLIETIIFFKFKNEFYPVDTLFEPLSVFKKGNNENDIHSRINIRIVKKKKKKNRENQKQKRRTNSLEDSSNRLIVSTQHHPFRFNG